MEETAEDSWRAFGRRKATTYRAVAVIGPALVIGIVGIIAIFSVHRSADADQWVNHTLKVFGTLKSIQARLTDAETGQRGYLLTGDTSYLQPWHDAHASVDQTLATARHLTIDNPVQQRHLDTLVGLAERKFAELDSTFALRTHGNPNAVAFFLRAKTGKAVMDSARHTLAAMESEEQRLLAIRADRAAWWRAATVWTVGIGTALAAFLALIINALLTRYAAAEREAARELEVRATQLHEQAQELEIQNEQLQDQTRELEMQNEELQAQAVEIETQAADLKTSAQGLADANNERMRVEEATRLKSEFLANMSHELRTPLNAIIGFTELLHNGKVPTDSPEHHEYLGDVLTSARHLLQLINDVLDLSKIEAGKLQFYPEAVDLSGLVGEVLSIMRTNVATKRIGLEVTIDPSLTDVVLDAGRFKQVLYNYVSNALKFTPEGGRVAVRVTKQGPEFRVEVEDTGIGISAEDLSRLFVEFEQLDRGVAKQHGGTGLGLALTKRLVEAQEGKVGVTSILGQGSTFYAVFPRQAAVAASRAVPASFDGASPGARTVLVIEDDARDQSVLVKTLTDAGYAVETAATGTQALAKCRTRTFDAITLDLLLPDMSGLDVLRAIREGQENQHVPVIIVTIVTEHGVAGGFAVHDILGKPLDSAALLGSLERAGISPDRTGHVLVVDDDAGSRELMATTLNRLGFTATCVHDGNEGIRIARTTPPLAVVLDLVMPEMDGFTFLDQFRGLPTCERVPVIVWTVADLTVAQQRRLRASAQGVMAKDRHGSRAVVEELHNFLAEGVTVP